MISEYYLTHSVKKFENVYIIAEDATINHQIENCVELFLDFTKVTLFDSIKDANEHRILMEDEKILWLFDEGDQMISKHSLAFEN